MRIHFLLACMLLLSLGTAGMQLFGAQPPNIQSLSPEQREAFKKLTPEQQAAILEELSKSGGTLTPEALDALKTRPEFQGLSPQDIVKGMSMLEKQEGAKKEVAKKAAEDEMPGKPKPQTEQIIIKPGQPFAGEGEQSAPIKTTLGNESQPQSLYERAREIRKYQDISLDLKPFGYDFFREAAVTVSTGRKDIPVPLKYVVGPGDEVRVVLWGRVNASYYLTVDRDGKISIPNIGPLVVAGMTFEQMSGYLIKQAEQITGTNVDVSMGALRTIPIFVLGDVRRPGAYTIGSFATIVDALLLAGGPADIGSMRNIQLKRKDKVIQTFDLYDLLLKGDKSHDAMLFAGDIIFVPVIGPYVGIAGNVKRPAIYELKDDFSLAHIFDLAGGIVPTAYTQQIQVERTVKSEKKIIVDINDKDLAGAKTTVLQDTDVVKVFAIVEKDVNLVTLQGNVKRGGKYALKPGMRIKDILPDEKDLLPETYFDYALIKRQIPPRMEPLLIPFNLGDLLLRNQQESNLELQPLDSIYIFSKWFFRDKPFFTVNGEVRKAGRFDLPDNFKVKDALLAAGDLTKNAYMKKGEIVRVNKKKEYQTIYFNVASALTDDPAENLLVQDEDSIVIHSLYEEQWKEQAAVAGEVKSPGDFLLTQGMRVSDLFFKAGGQTRDTLLDQAELYRTDWKTKEVTLAKISLAKALQGEPGANLELKDLDRLIVHSLWETVYKKVAMIDGDIQKPGTYPLAEKMTVRDLVFAAGNILESAFIEDAEISSQAIKPNGQVAIEHKNINLGRALAGDTAHNLVLNPYDRLVIKRIPDWRQEKFVNLAGEIKFPGKYVIAKGEKLSSIIERAGGYQDSAYLRGAFFTRERVRDLQQKSIAEMADRLERELLAANAVHLAAVLSAEDAAGKKVELDQKQKFVDNLRKLKATGRMTVYLASIDFLKGSEYDIVLEDGDNLLIPQKNSVVNVAGAVMAQGSYIYSDKMTYKDYISQTGGYARFANKSDVFVMKTDGSAWRLSPGFLRRITLRGSGKILRFGDTNKPIEPGDTIIVPENTNKTSWFREIKDITQVMMNVAVTAGVVLKLY
jgi:polysaccharide biosynthesis/export protein